MGALKIDTKKIIKASTLIRTVVFSLFICSLTKDDISTRVSLIALIVLYNYFIFMLKNIGRLNVILFEYILFLFFNAGLIWAIGQIDWGNANPRAAALVFIIHLTISGVLLFDMWFLTRPKIKAYFQEIKYDYVVKYVFRIAIPVVFMATLGFLINKILAAVLTVGALIVFAVKYYPQMKLEKTQVNL